MFAPGIYRARTVEGVPPTKNPMVGSFASCCACAASGHATVAPPRSVMKLRRFTADASRASDRNDSTPRYGRFLKLRGAVSRYPASLKASYREKLAVADWDETSGELSIGTDQRHERRHLLWMGRRVVD